MINTFITTATLIMLQVPTVAIVSSRSSSTSSRSYSSSRSTSSSSRSSTVRQSGRSLSSRTPAPKPHAYNGQTYNSSAAQYTNTSGMWVFYWAMIATNSGNKELQCFDKDHKRTTCNRDKKSYQRDW